MQQQSSNQNLQVPHPISTGPPNDSTSPPSSNPTSPNLSSTTPTNVSFAVPSRVHSLPRTQSTASTASTLTGGAPQQQQPQRSNTISSLGWRKASTASISSNQTGGSGGNLATQDDSIQLSNLPEDYEIKNAIGYGSSAIVYIANYKPLSKMVAIKMIDLDMFERNQIDELRRETQVMSLCKHPNVLRVLNSFVADSKLYIITPFLSAGSCLDIMKTAFPEGLDEVSIATILKQALQGLDYLHKNGHIHRDVKAGNLLVDDDGTVMLADFGVTASLESDRKGVRKTFVGTPCWMAPEVMEQAGYDFKADIWSFGITALELANGHAPLAKFPPIKVLMLTLSNDPPTLNRDATRHKYSKSFKEMIDLCLHKDPSKRPTAEKLLGHSFFKNAKKKPWLVSNLLNTLPPLVERQRKKPTQAAPQPAQGVSWDFESASDSSVNTATAHLRAELANVAQQQRFMQQQQQQRDAENGASSANTPIYSPASAGSTELVNGNGTASGQGQGQGQVYGLGIAGNGGQQQHGGMASAVSQMEIRKGRFSVSEGQPGETPQMAGGDSQSSSTPPSLERRSRFEVTTSNSGGGQQPQQGQGDPAGVAPAATRRGRFEVSNVDDGSGSPPTITRAQSLRKDSASAAGAGSVTLNGPGNGLSIGIGGQAQIDRLQSQVETLHRRNEELVKLVGVLIERLGGTNSANVVGTFNQRIQTLRSSQQNSPNSTPTMQSINPNAPPMSSQTQQQQQPHQLPPSAAQQSQSQPLPISQTPSQPSSVSSLSSNTSASGMPSSLSSLFSSISIPCLHEVIGNLSNQMNVVLKEQEELKKENDSLKKEMERLKGRGGL